MTNRWILFSLSIVLLGACKEEKEDAPVARRGNAPISVEGYIVKTKVLSENIVVPGTLMPFETTQIRPEISGRIVQLNIPEGRAVQKGTLLAKLFDGDLKAQLEKLKVQLSIAEKTAERYGELVKISGISQQEYDLTELQVNNLKADIQLVQVDINRTEIRAPYSGQIGLKNLSLGAYVTPADILTSISQVNKLKIEFTVPEKYSDRMSRGKEVVFTVAGSPQEYRAKIIATESIISADTRSLRVLGEVTKTSNALVPGAFANVSLQMGSSDASLIIPTQAVIPEARNKKVILYEDGKPVHKVITTGIRDSSYVQVLDGLVAGDTIITTGLLAIRPGSSVTLTKIQ